MKLTCQLALASALAASFAFGQQDSAALRKEIEALREGQKAMQKDLEEIKNLLKSQRGGAAARPGFANVQLAGEGVLVRGDLKAPVTIVEYTDLQCPFCSRHASSTYSQIENEYVKTGKVRYIVKDFPLESIHAHAFKAAEATRCANEQGKGWEMHDRMFANQQKLAADQLVTYAEALGLDAAKFQACVASNKYAPAVRKDIAEALSAGITGTPAFLLGSLDQKTMKVKPAKFLNGALAFSAFKAAIDELLDQNSAVAPSK